ncbi:MAG: hypothetical protein GX663_10015 [Clostridiales bacterium]|nr:hypothetical protein [Clostridiales bacterium]
MKYDLKQEIYDGLKTIGMTALYEKKAMSITRMLKRLMDMEELPMHCPYHHFILPAALLVQTAVQEGKTEAELSEWLELAEERAKTVPAGFCGECGTCGSAVGVGIFISIYTKATPKSVENWKWANEATGLCLQKIASYPGPRCCKRTSFLAANEGVPYINKKLGLKLTVDEGEKCSYHNINAECIENECPFFDPKEDADKAEDRKIAIIVEAEKMPKKDLKRTCKCMNEPIELNTKKGVLTWLKSIGDDVKQGDVICEGEVEKKVMEFTASDDGILTDQCIKDGETFAAGSILGYIKVIKS